MHSRYKPRHAALLLTAVLCAIVIAWAWSGKEGGSPSSSSTTRPSEPSSVVASSDPPAFRTDKAALVRRASEFSKLYYSLSSDVSPTQQRAAVLPYATDHFLQTARFGFGTSEADQAMIEEGASLTARPISDFVGHFVDDNTADGEISLSFTKKNRDGIVVTSFTINQSMTWVKQDNVWLIYEAPST